MFFVCFLPKVNSFELLKLMINDTVHGRSEGAREERKNNNNVSLIDSYNLINFVLFFSFKYFNKIECTYWLVDKNRI